MATVADVLDAVRAAEAAGASPAEVRDAALSAAARGPAPAAAPAAPTTPTAYRAKDGDVLDAVAVALYGAESAVLDVLAANPALARTPHLVAGTLVGLPPAAPHPPERRAVQLWD